MFVRRMLARCRLARPPYAQDVADIAGMLTDLGRHLAAKDDARGLVLWRRLHHRLQQVAETAPPGSIEVGTFSATPKPADD
ncbi:MAG: hypothetical protein KGQ52_13465 [Alphaproteobacteria bacterium]|nr:hypothetical protein [Alphaproteobacteria bacterium]